MDTHKLILAFLISNSNIEGIDDSSDIDLAIFKELLDSGFVKAVDACADDGDCFLEPRITLSGREWVQKQQSVSNKNLGKEDIVEIKPNFMGIGINLNAAYRRFKRK